MSADEEMLTDYLDGRMSSAAKAEFERRLGDEPVLAHRARWAQAMRRALTLGVPPLPEDLKAKLLAQARRHVRIEVEVPLRGSLWSALYASPWTWGAGAAFAAAALAVVLKCSWKPCLQSRDIAIREKSPTHHLSPDLWSEDDGQDHDK